MGVSAYYIFEPKFSRKTMLEGQRKEMLQKIEEKDRAIEMLKRNQERFENDDTFVEYIARQNRRIRKNEFIFINVDN